MTDTENKINESLFLVFRRTVYRHSELTVRYTNLYNLSKHVSSPYSNSGISDNINKAPVNVLQIYGGSLTLVLYIYIYIYSTNIPPIMIINKIY